MQGIQVENRFGWGARPGETRTTPWRDWLAAQLGPDDPTRFTGVGDCADGLIALRTQRENKLRGNPLVKPILQAELATQSAALLSTEQPFRDRLAWFWFNHFTVSQKQDRVKGVVGAYMREAIRPHLTGRFVDLLMAVMRHPAMLLYLDNTGSVGPDSPAGLRQHRGLNENLARECLELHTVSPAAGYSQSDVTSFAAILTGWGVDMKAERPGFHFAPRAHQPGEKMLLGQRFPQGEEGGLAALDFLGTHPATYRHIATQMVRHFLTDMPSATQIAPVFDALNQTQGSLRAASLALIDLPGAAAPGATMGKLRSPMEFVMAVLRASGATPEAMPPDTPHNPTRILVSGCAALGQPLWTAPMPNGWSDAAAEWSAPADLLARTDWAYRYAATLRDRDPMAIAHAALGGSLRPETQLAMHRAGSRQDALTLLFSSPEFQRR
ncbi:MULTISPECIES: DUF1800 domain-containing protein [Asaia]|uniref:DUF1800 domain-containing protein n=1 Tax=Asaia spathodeae TaxID=657016 RepID=A0ABX2P2D0_9PROT|nr:DUF1800 domain-containing protein [Asaia spathodeae]GBR17039.1 hypothetical protein AA105894_1718 [Asaia spathodeae NBRC 105894]